MGSWELEWEGVVMGVKQGWFRRPRFSLWAMLVLVTVVAIPLAYVAQRRSWNLRRAAVIEKFTAKGASFKYGGLASFMTKPSPPLTWWQKLCGDLPAVNCVKIIEKRLGTPAEKISDEDLRELAMLSEIETVRLGAASNVTDEGLRALAALPHLKQFLTEQMPQVEGSFLEAWAKTNQIENLSFSSMPKLKGIHLKPLGTLTHLKFFSIYRCESITPAECDQVDLPANLIHLQIGQTLVGDENLRRWLEQTQIESLSLDVGCSRAIAPGLTNQTQLKTLHIRNSPLIDEDLFFLEQCRDLEVLHLSGLPVHGSFLKKIGRNSKLMALALDWTPLTEENAAELRRFSKLSSLELSWTPITGEFLAAKSWPKLNHLALEGVQFGEQGKSNLASLSIPGAIAYPINWTWLDFRRYQSVKPPMRVTLNENTAKDADTGLLPPNTRFVTPGFMNDAIERCRQDLMAPVIRLREFARMQNEKANEPVKGKE